MSKIGFFGGCFNPPTIAHFEIVKNAISKFNLDKVVIVPMGDKYQKKELISFEHRFTMLEKMFADEEKVDISRMQENQKQTTYAIDSFKEIDKEYENDERYFIMGDDNFSRIESWKNYKELLENRNFIVFERSDIASSSLIRQKIKTNEDVESLTFPEITGYIKREGLYK